MSANIQGLESPSRKRSHEEFAEGSSYNGPSVLEGEDMKKQHIIDAVENTDIHATMRAIPTISRQSLPPEGSPLSLTDAASTPARNSPSPNPTPTRTTDSAPSASAPQAQVPLPATQGLDPTQPSLTFGKPAVKKKRLTLAEKEAKVKEEAAKKQEREEAKAAREKAKQEKEEAKNAKAAERAKAEAEKKARQEERDRKKREKEEEEKKIQEEKERKRRSQLKLGAFFSVGPSTPSKKGVATTLKLECTQTGASEKSPKKAVLEPVSEYEKIFKPFFVKEQVTLATTPFVNNNPETRAAKSRILDEYLSGKRGTFDLQPFDHAKIFNLPFTPPPRGRIYPSVRKVMAEFSGTSTSPINLTTEAQNSQIKQAQDLLKEVPMKFLAFKEDVRPPYYGTITMTPASGNLQRLARNPSSRTLLPLNYEYDSEAEWVDDGDGEDIDDLDDEEEEMDEDEEMGDFLDDSEDHGLIRAAFSSGMEPQSTGLCWEDSKHAALPQMHQYRMEFILESLDDDLGVDPFSTKYWEPEPKPSTKKQRPAAVSSLYGTKGSQAVFAASGTVPPMAPPPAPGDAFAALNQNLKADSKKLAIVPTEMTSDFRHSILEYPTLSKVGLIELLSAKFPKCTKAQVRNSLDSMAEQVGSGRAKEWKLKAGFEL